MLGYSVPKPITLGPGAGKDIAGAYMYTNERHRQHTPLFDRLQWQSKRYSSRRSRFIGELIPHHGQASRPFSRPAYCASETHVCRAIVLGVMASGGIRDPLFLFANT